MVVFLILFFIGGVYLLTNNLEEKSKTEEKSKSDPKVDELSNKMILLLHWTFITDTVNEQKTLSNDLNIKSNDEIQERLNYFLNEYDRHKSNLQKLDVIEKYDPVRTKMIQYVETIQDGLKKISIGVQNGDSSAMSEAGHILFKAKDIENEISTIIKVW